MTLAFEHAIRARREAAQKRAQYQANYRMRKSQAKPMPSKASVRMRRKRCLNCKELYPPTKPNRKFCSDECKNLFNRFGPGYDAIFKKLTENLSKLIEEATADHMKLLRSGIEACTATLAVHNQLLKELDERVKQCRVR